ncbi:sensor domain-containing protein [Microbacterium sp.]|uniref:sensor histidine kinase n=1 Tax=Microbacterium sp. TaxID=51671 RepID=UPI002810ECB2|nr:sensor domain-containing protein [Microbacterium sp.]
MTVERPTAPRAAGPALTAPRPDPGWGYASLWTRVPGTALYVIVRFAIATLSISLLSALFFAGVGTIVIVIGLPLIVLSLLVARGLGVADRYLLLLTGLPFIREPEWDRDRTPRVGFWGRLTLPLRNPHYWSSLLHGTLVSIVLSAVSFAIVVGWLSAGLGGLTHWFWSIFIPDAEGGEWGRYVAEFLPWVFGTWPPGVVEGVLIFIAGVIFTATMPWVFGALARLHHGAAGALVGRWPSDDLAVELRAETAARGAAVRAEDEGLRRLERDLHDGPQQRLVRLQFDLAALERRAAAGDGDAAAQLAREALAHAQGALDELRALSSGVAPPLLQDRGLSAALHGLAATSPLDVRVEAAPELDAAVPSDIARNAYFVAAELLTNAAKHSAARSVTMRVWTAAATESEPAALDLWVVDDGRGGAFAAPGHGLEGLAQRLAGLRGTLSVDSPAGGPTRIGAHIPLAAPAG